MQISCSGCLVLPSFLQTKQYTVTPLFSGPLLSGHPLLNGHFSNSQKSVPLFTVNVTSIKVPITLK